MQTATKLRELKDMKDGVTHFSTGAIRDAQDGKEIYMEPVSWTAFRRYAQYMTPKQKKYGPGNWRKGIDIESYENSLCRHLTKYFINKYEGGDIEPEEDHLAAMVFNIFGIMHEEEVEKTREKKIKADLVAMTSQELFGGYERLYKSLAGIQEETNYMDARTPEERAQDKSVLTSAVTTTSVQEETECKLGEPHSRELCPVRHPFQREEGHKPRTEETYEDGCVPADNAGKGHTYLKGCDEYVIGGGSPTAQIRKFQETEKEGASFSGRGEVERTNELLRSMASIVARRGKDVNWDAFGANLDAELKRQHAIMFPRPKENTTSPHFAGWKDTSTTPQSREQGGENNK